jgi:glycosyltransferase involved in cell wall biosynthesis
VALFKRAGRILVNTPFVSIVIPCYNAERYVGEAIQSALDQTYTNREVIVIDDGSTDRSVEVIRSFGDTLRWESGSNHGGSTARNRGLKLARGEFVQFLDADDLLHPNKLSSQVPLAEANWADVVYCDWRTEFLDCSQDVIISSPSLLDDPVLFALFREMQTASPLHRKELLERVDAFRTDLPCAQEYDLNLRLACNGATYCHCVEVLLTVRRLPNSVSSDSVRVLDQWRDIYWRALRELRERGQLTDERAAAFAARMAHNGRAYLSHGLIERAQARFREAYQMHPSGGLHGAYGRLARVLRKALGPIATERLVQWKRRLNSRCVLRNR